VQFRLLVKIGGDVTKRHLTFAIRRRFEPGHVTLISRKRTWISQRRFLSSAMDKDKTLVEAVIGSGEKVELLWTPRVKRAAEVAATVFCQNSALVTLGGGMVNVRATLDYQVTQGELRQTRVRLPAGQRLLRVEGNGIRTWEIKGRAAGRSSSSNCSRGHRRHGVSRWKPRRCSTPCRRSRRSSAARADVKRETGLAPCAARRN
jgi:hypothetical protein